MLEEDIIAGWQMEQELRPGKYALTDYNFETPSTSLAVNVASTINVGGNGKYEVYDYPGEYLKKAQGERLAKIRMEEEEAPHVVVSGSGSCRAFTPGYRFDLAGHYSAEMDKCYVLTEVQHVASVGESYSGGRADARESYSNHFICIPHDVPFRPARVTPKPTVQGPQTAIVVGRSGEEIYTDKYGRVKVQFHWDREGKRNENSSCWVRVSHPWAGKGWGAVAIPRIGQEVIVDFLEGDPDQPVITGRLYNAEQMPPYALPANQTQSGIKSRSSKGGDGENFNEIRFEDKKGDEELYIHAEKDENTVVEHDQGIAVGNDRAESIKRDRRLEVGRDKLEKVNRDKSIQVVGNHTEQINDAMSIVVGSTLTETVAINYAETVGLAMELTVGAALAITVGAAMAETVAGAKTESIGGSKTEGVGSNRTLSVGNTLSEIIKGEQIVKIGKDLAENVGGKHREEVKEDYMLLAKRVQIVAQDEINIKTGKAEIIMKKNGDITIKGKQINVKGTGDVIIKGSKIAEN
jgi:type VI secretion system secreted protein VgrG